MLRINGLHLSKLVAIAYLYDSQSLQCGSVNKRKLLVAIYVQGKIFQGSHVSMKKFYLELYYY